MADVIELTSEGVLCELVYAYFVLISETIEGLRNNLEHEREFLRFMIWKVTF